MTVSEHAIDRLLDHVVQLQREVASRDDLLHRIWAAAVTAGELVDRELTEIEAEIVKLILDFSLRTDALAPA